MINVTRLSSNVPFKIFYTSLLAEDLRIGRTTTESNNYKSSCETLISTMIKGALSGLRQFLATDHPLKMMKNAFHFALKPFSVLKIFKFLSSLRGHVEKWLD